ncbi:MAG: hypothetical protein LBN74_03345 [Prevotella sp.]|jgi:hypothetical protein|nr:hypothetical protein [Prevotella sp.]
MKHFKTILIFFFGLSPCIFAQTPEELKSYLPEIPDWVISKKIEIFNPDNLFDRIDGAAPLFIENNFREMTSMEYTKGDDYITIQAYRHATPEDAFGMYAAERSPDLTFYPFAAEAQGDDGGVFFVSGSVYVKMWSSSSDNVGDVLRKVAEELAEKIDPDSEYPAIVKVFPDEGKVIHSEAYVTSNYIGHEFLNAVYTAKYGQTDKSFQLFVIDGKTKDGAKEILTKYFTFTKQPVDFEEGELTITDKYNGNIPVIWKGQYIIGLYSENGDTIKDADVLLNKIAENL